MRSLLRILLIAFLLIAASATTSFSGNKPPELYFRVNMDQRMLPDQRFSIFPGEEATLIWDENELIILNVIETTKDGCVIRWNLSDDFEIKSGVSYQQKVFFQHRMFSFTITYDATKGVVVKDLDMKIAKRE
jgi:hypothetical protein